VAAVAVLVYDGDCGFCTRSATWLRRHARDLRVVPWQGADLGVLGLSEAQCAAAVQLIAPTGRFSGGQAVAEALRLCLQPYRALGRVLGWRVLRPVVEFGYRVVAANRHRLPGSTCAVSDRDVRTGGRAVGDGPGAAVAPPLG
jgi:predicted DCC family thiol-disulfide oxidoreductase YuxK